MNNFRRFLIVSVLIVFSSFPVFSNGENEVTDSVVTEAAEWVDYVSLLKLDMNSETVKCEVKVKNYVDGDTTHFYISEEIVPNGVLKARYLAVNTPESTGKIEEYGKKASNFTKDKLSRASSIIVESDNEIMNLDSTGSRYLVWVWYRNSEDEDYRNLNLEILQNGLAIASSAANNRYGSFCTSAISQARNNKLNVYSGEKDPDFWYGDSVELTLKELRSNIENYNGVKVAFEGVITAYYNNGIYVEDYDGETDMYNGIYVYIGFGLSGSGQALLDVGNRVRLVGIVSYYETGDSWQVAGLQYKATMPDNPDNIRLISSGNSASYQNVPASYFNGKTVEIEADDGNIVLYDWAEMALGTSVEVDNLQVVSIYTTDDEASSSYGAMTMNCVAEDGSEVQIRTGVLTNSKRKVVTQEAYEGKNISVKGWVDKYEGNYQIKVLMEKQLVINE